MKVGGVVIDKNDNEQKVSSVVNVCLEQFVSKGLMSTTSRDLSRALNLQSAGMYSYFQNKDDAVIACAESAAKKLEDDLIAVAIENVSSPYEMIVKLREKAEQLAPMMRFFTQVCATEKYEERIRPVLSNLSCRYEKCVERFADELNVSVDVIRPYVYICITAITNYMVYQEDSYTMPQLTLVAKILEEIKQPKHIDE